MYTCVVIVCHDYFNIVACKLNTLPSTKLVYIDAFKCPHSPIIRS